MRDRGLLEEIDEGTTESQKWVHESAECLQDRQIWPSCHGGSLSPCLPWLDNVSANISQSAPASYRGQQILQRSAGERVPRFRPCSRLSEQDWLPLQRFAHPRQLSTPGHRKNTMDDRKSTEEEGLWSVCVKSGEFDREGGSASVDVGHRSPAFATEYHFPRT